MTLPPPDSPGSVGKPDLVLVAAATRSGQTWLCYLLAHYFNARFLEPYCLLRGIQDTGHQYVQEMTRGRLPGRTATGVEMVIKTHECPDPHFSLTRRVVLLARDPRDTVTSAVYRYRVMSRTGTDIEEDAQKLALQSEPVRKPANLKDWIWRLVYGQRLLAVLLTARKWATFYGAWRQLTFCRIVRYEDLLKDTGAEFSRLVAELGYPVDPAQVAESVHGLSFAEISRRQTAGNPELRIGFRKAKAGDFRGNLTRLELAIVRWYCRESAEAFGYDL